MDWGIGNRKSEIEGASTLGTPASIFLPFVPRGFFGVETAFLITNHLRRNASGEQILLQSRPILFGPGE